MKTLITELSNEICVSVNDIMRLQQTMPQDLYTGVGKRTWFTEEGVEFIRKHFTGPHYNSSTLIGIVIGKCPNPRFVYVKIPNKEGKIVVKIPTRLAGKMDGKRIGVEKLDHDGQISYQWCKIDENASLA